MYLLLFLSGLGVGILLTICALSYFVMARIGKDNKEKELPYLELMKERNEIARKTLEFHLRNEK